MAGTKRSWEGQLLNFPDKSNTMATAEVVSRSSTIQAIFRTFCSELDDHHDRRERVVKASRDITALSKKMYAPELFSHAKFLVYVANQVNNFDRIFSLQRSVQIRAQVARIYKENH
jgi:hypothetical protein